MSVIVPVNLIAIAPRGRARGQLEVVGATMCVIRPGRFGVTRGAARPIPKARNAGWFVGPADALALRQGIPPWLRRRIPPDEPELHYLAIRIEDEQGFRDEEWWLFEGSPELVHRADAALAGEVTSVIHDPTSAGSSPVSPHSLLAAAAFLAAIGVILEILTLT